MKRVLLSLFFISFNTLALFGEDTALLINLVTTTASQLNELEKLVTNAEKYTQKMQHYNDLFQDQYFKAERVAYLAEEVASKRKIENLDDLNYAIRELKYSMEELKFLMKEYGAIKDEEYKTKQIVKIQKRLNERKMARAKTQVAHSIKADTTGRSSQLTAQNTALMHETQIEMQNTQLEILEKVSTNNRLMAEQMEEKRLEQIEKEKSYNFQKRGGLK